MTSPFAPFVNSEITVKVPGEGITTDRYGNPVIKSDELTIKAYLKGKSVTDRGLAGQDELQQEFEGFAVEPMQVPSSVPFIVEGEVNISGVVGRCVIRRSPPTDVEKTTGTKLIVTFKWGAYA